MYLPLCLLTPPPPHAQREVLPSECSIHDHSWKANPLECVNITDTWGPQVLLVLVGLLGYNF